MDRWPPGNMQCCRFIRLRVCNSFSRLGRLSFGLIKKMMFIIIWWSYLIGLHHSIPIAKLPIHSQSRLSFLFSNYQSALQFDRRQFVERESRDVSITTKLLIAWFTSTRGVYQMRLAKPVHLLRAKESLLIQVINCAYLCRVPVISGYIISTFRPLFEW